VTETQSKIVRDGDGFTPSAALHVDVIADLVCPFCFIGKRRLDEALKAVQGPSDVSWYPFQLNPEIPAEGQPFDDYLQHRFGSAENIEPVLRYLAAEGKGVGIDFRFDLLRHVPNTVQLHQLLQLADVRGLDQSALAESLLSAFFEDGRNIGDRDELIDIVAAHGLSAEDVTAAAESDRLRQIVLSREAQARSSGLVGVPGYLMNRRLLVVGAQGTDVMINAFDQAMFGAGNDSLVSPTLH
jgi:predicted DsbA family dithiol-disulfide isomerase